MTTSGNDKSQNYLVHKLNLEKDQIVDYKDDNFFKKAIEKNGGYFDIALDLVGGKMLSACCELLAIDGDLASVTEPPDKNGFEILFQKNASFHSIGANAYSLSNKQEYWKNYQHILNVIAKLFDSND